MVLVIKVCQTQSATTKKFPKNLPVSAKSCIFAAEIGLKTCRYIPQKQYTILLTPAKWYIVINPFYLEIVEILNNISRLELHIFEFVV